MRFVNGADLRTLVLRDGPPAPGRAADVVGRIGAGLDVIHRAGYVHRDVKPANVLIDARRARVRDGLRAGQANALARRSDARPGSGSARSTTSRPSRSAAGRSTRAPTSTRSAACCASCSPATSRSSATATRRSCGRSSREPPPMPSAAASRSPARSSTMSSRARWPRSRGSAIQSAGDLGRAAAAVAAGDTPWLRERMVARGAAAPAVLADRARRRGVDGDGGTSATRSARPDAGRAVPSLGLVALSPRSRRPRDRRLLAPERPSARAARRSGWRRRSTVSGDRPNGIVVAGGDVWVIGATRTTVTRIDIATSRSRRRVADSRPRRVEHRGGTGHSVWVAAKDARRVIAHRRADRPRRPRAAPGRRRRALAAGGGLPVGGHGRRRLTARPSWCATTVTGTERDRLPMPRGVAALATGGGFVWVAERKGNAILRLDPRTGQLRRWSKLIGPTSALYDERRTTCGRRIATADTSPASTPAAPGTP